MKHGKSRIGITSTGGSADVEKNRSGSMTLVCIPFQVNERRRHFSGVAVRFFKW